MSGFESMDPALPLTLAATSSGFAPLAVCWLITLASIARPLGNSVSIEANNFPLALIVTAACSVLLLALTWLKCGSALGFAELAAR